MTALKTRIASISRSEQELSSVACRWPGKMCCCFSFPGGRRKVCVAFSQVCGWQLLPCNSSPAVQREGEKRSYFKRSARSIGTYCWSKQNAPQLAAFLFCISCPAGNADGERRTFLPYLAACGRTIKLDVSGRGGGESGHISMSIPAFQLWVKACLDH